MHTKLSIAVVHTKVKKSTTITVYLKVVDCNTSYNRRQVQQCIYLHCNIQKLSNPAVHENYINNNNV